MKMDDDRHGSLFKLRIF